MDSEKKIIVIADDSTAARMIIKRCVEVAGFDNAEFMQAENGREALRILKKNKVSLLLTDYNMPVMDGGVLLKWVKGSPNIKDVPVVIITSAGNEARDKQLIEMGAMKILYKPISPQKLSEELEDILINW